jgi:hypothetical protein
MRQYVHLLHGHSDMIRAVYTSISAPTKITVSNDRQLIDYRLKLQCFLRLKKSRSLRHDYVATFYSHMCWD